MTARRWNVNRDDSRSPDLAGQWLAMPDGDHDADCLCRAFPTHAEALAYATTQARTEQEPCS